MYLDIYFKFGKDPLRNDNTACGVMVIVIGYGHGDTNSNPRRDWLHFT